MTLRADECYRSQVDRHTLKALSRRSDHESLIHFGCYFACYACEKETLMSETLGNDWHRVCATHEIPPEDVLPFEVGEHNLAVYNTPAGFFATDGLCTHEEQPLADGFVIDTVIECPLHQGRFDVRSGKALCPPVCVDLKTYPVQVIDDAVYVQIA